MPQPSPRIEPENLTHESKIPPIANKARHHTVQTYPTSTSTSLSFALPTSLAFFKRLTWELTLWTRPDITPTTANTISSHIPSLPPSAIRSAICLGVGYTGMTNDPKDQQPQLYIVFPHLQRDIDEDFWRIWHDEIVKPAFDEAWISSGLVSVWEAEDGSWSTVKAGPSAEQVLDRFDNVPEYRRYRAQHVEWPKWEDLEWEFSSPPDTYTLSKGMEGGFSDRRALVFDETWSAMRDMLKGGDEPREMSDPVLLAVWEKSVRVGESASVESLAKTVGVNWDAYVDSRFVEEGMFVVHVGEVAE